MSILLGALDHQREHRMRKDKATLVKGSERGTGKRVGGGGKRLHVYTGGCSSTIARRRRHLWCDWSCHRLRSQLPCTIPPACLSPNPWGWNCCCRRIQLPRRSRPPSREPKPRSNAGGATGSQSGILQPASHHCW